jgi:GNAT superfamily N-acetyltransferase
MDVVEISTADTYALRRAVLRDNDPSRSVEFPEDDLPGTVHLGIRNELHEIVATSSWVPKECPHYPGMMAVQLRGMATAAELQGRGVGGLLIETGIARHSARGFELMWARARDSALGFYDRHQCTVIGEGFIDDTTRLSHHVVVRRLRAGIDA